jgi:hypothetical protein
MKKIGGMTFQEIVPHLSPHMCPILTSALFPLTSELPSHAALHSHVPYPQMCPHFPLKHTLLSQVPYPHMCLPLTCVPTSHVPSLTCAFPSQVHAPYTSIPHICVSIHLNCGFPSHVALPSFTLYRYPHVWVPNSFPFSVSHVCLGISVLSVTFPTATKKLAIFCIAIIQIASSQPSNFLAPKHTAYLHHT